MFLHDHYCTFTSRSFHIPSTCMEELTKHYISKIRFSYRNDSTILLSSFVRSSRTTQSISTYARVAAFACNNEPRISSPMLRLVGTNVVRQWGELPTSRIISKYCVNNNKSMTSLAFAVVSLENSTILFCIQKKKETGNVRVRGMYVRKEIYTHQQTNKQNNWFKFQLYYYYWLFQFL